MPGARGGRKGGKPGNRSPVEPALEEGAATSAPTSARGEEQPAAESDKRKIGGKAQRAEEAPAAVEAAAAVAEPPRPTVADALNAVIASHKLTVDTAAVVPALEKAVAEHPETVALVKAAHGILDHTGAAREFAKRMTRPADVPSPVPEVEVPKSKAPTPRQPPSEPLLGDAPPAEMELANNARPKVPRAEQPPNYNDSNSRAGLLQAPRMSSFVATPEVVVEGLPRELQGNEEELREMVRFHTGRSHLRMATSPIAPNRPGTAFLWLVHLREAITLTRLPFGTLVMGSSAFARAPTPEEVKLAGDAKRAEADAISAAAEAAVKAVEDRYASAASAKTTESSAPEKPALAAGPSDADREAAARELANTQRELASYKEELELLQELDGAAADAQRKLEVLQSMKRLLARIKELQAVQAPAAAAATPAATAAAAATGPLERKFSSSSESVVDQAALLMLSGFKAPMHDDALLAFLDAVGIVPRHIWRSPSSPDICVELPAAWQASRFLGGAISLRDNEYMGVKFRRWQQDAAAENTASS
mmetsp:Transcript_10270/g.31737  ORF Transcript_10270/g.31737 Transcript_10270/m.31737 type:complete len:537 (-) Transcript_10270:43-1653(-)